MKKNINQLIAQANPDHAGIIKEFHAAKQNNYLGELDEMLNDSDSEEEEGDEK